jgi:hypothetical protein
LAPNRPPPFSAVVSNDWNGSSQVSVPAELTYEKSVISTDASPAQAAPLRARAIATPSALGLDTRRVGQVFMCLSSWMLSAAIAPCDGVDQVHGIDGAPSRHGI